jgi:hypothetical protein
MKIANIVYEKELVNHNEVEFINYHKGGYESLNADLPTLFVGWEFMKQFPLAELKDVNILKHRIIENKLYWEFSFDENKSSHVSGIQSFIEYVPKFYFTPRYQYENIDPVFHQLRDNQDLFDVLPKEITKAYVLKNRMLYILSGQKIYGLDLDMYKFFKFNVDGIKEKVTEMSFAFFDDPDGKYYEKYYKIFPDFSFLKRYLVVLVSN